MQIQRTVRLVTVQENRDTGDGDVGQTQGDQHHLPDGKRKQAVKTHGIPLRVYNYDVMYVRDRIVDEVRDKIQGQW